MFTAYSPCARRLRALAPDPLLAALEDFLLPHRYGLLERVDRLAAGVHRRAAVGRLDGADDARLADRDVACAVCHGDVEDVVAALHRLGNAGHLGLGHLGVGVVLEVDNGAAAAVPPRRADERRDRARSRVGYLGDDGVEVEGVGSDGEGAAGDRRDHRDLVPRGHGGVAVGVLAVAGVGQAGRLVTEVERRPHVGDDGAVGQVELPFRPPRPLTQGGEEPHRDPHPPKGIRLVAGRVEARAAALYPPPGGVPEACVSLETRRSVQPCRRRRSGQPGLLYPARVAAADRERLTESGIPIKPVYRAADAPDERPAPADYPYTRGVRPDGYRERPWTMRQYAGFSSAEETNRRFRLLLDRGQTGLSVAFDLPTQLGLDS